MLLILIIYDSKKDISKSNVTINKLVELVEYLNNAIVFYLLFRIFPPV